MKPLSLAVAAALIATAAAAQGTNQGSTSPSAPLPALATPGMNNPTNSVIAPGATVTPPPGPVNGNNGAAAAGGNGNQAVATTSANASRPAHGANSFSRGQARTRIANHGFQNVSDLHKDSNGVWHGKAMKNGQQVGVWLDYKGNVGQQ